MALVWSVTAPAAEPRIGKFVKYDTGDFVIVTSRSGSQAREIMQKLVKFRVTLEKVLGKRAARSGIGTHIFITGSGDWEKYLQPRERIAGFFNRSRFDNYMALDGDAGEYAIYVMFHEYAHFYCHRSSRRVPPWFNEAWRNSWLCEVQQDRRGAADPMFRVTRRATATGFRSSGSSSRLPLSRVPEPQACQQLYAQAWLTVHYGMVEERAFARQFFDYLNQLNKLVPQEEAARSAFGDLMRSTSSCALCEPQRTASGGLELGDVPEIQLPQPQA